MKNLRLLFTATIILLSLKLNAQQEEKFSITCEPFLQNVQNKSIAVFWEVNKNAVSWIEYGTDKTLGSAARESKDGMINVNSGIQKIRLEKLKPGTEYYYKILSCEIKTLEPYKVIYGDTVSTGIYKFKTPSKEDKKFTFLAFNDLHNRPGFIEGVVKNENDFDFAVFNGDILTDINDENDFAKKIFSPLSSYFAKEKPIYIVRGNHETRGAAARNLHKYIDSPNGKYYYTFTRGNTFFIMLDCGEDKPDKHNAYFGLADYDQYRSKEAEWLEKQVNSDEYKKAKFRIVCIHMPVKLNPGKDDGESHGVYECSAKFAPILNKAGIDLLLCGHTHKYEVMKQGKNTNKFPVIVGGGYMTEKNPERTTYTKVEVSKKKITAILKRYDGEILDKVVIEK